MFLQNLRAKVGARLNGDGEAGFTLIELLVVMLILGILAAIALPAFFNQKEKAGDAKAKEYAHTAQVAIETYATDNGGYVRELRSGSGTAGNRADPFERLPRRKKNLQRPAPSYEITWSRKHSDPPFTINERKRVRSPSHARKVKGGCPAAAEEGGRRTGTRLIGPVPSPWPSQA